MWIEMRLPDEKRIKKACNHNSHHEWLFMPMASVPDSSGSEACRARLASYKNLGVHFRMMSI